MRRSVLAGSIALVVATGVAVIPPTVATAATCQGAKVAVAQTQGPYYKAGAPARTNITQADTSGTPLILTGRVLDAACRPIAGARLDFWQADGRGRYDNVGYRLRGVQRTDAKGAFRLVTVIPGQYPGRTEHVHVKITPPGGSTFTTQLYFPGSQHNDEDGIFDPAMLVKVASDKPSLMRASYTFRLP
jgi:protocatechuate 3,4-dioxygenase beta subunit